jgi:perosamine synthetase
VTIEEYDELGYNDRMTDVQAAVGVEQVKKLDWILGRRQVLAARYTRLLSEMPGLSTPFSPSDAPHTYQSYAVRLDPATWPERDYVMQCMLAQGIATRRGIMAIHLEPYYRRRFGRISLPVTEEATRHTLLLPLFATMTEEEQDAVLNALAKVAGMNGR